MSKQDTRTGSPEGKSESGQPEIVRNEIGQAVDPTVVVDEADRTVLLTENETIVIEKDERIDSPPVNRARKVYSGMWGPVEIGVLGAGMLAVLGVVLLYVFFVVPSERTLENNRVRLNTLDAELTSARQKYGDISNVETHVGKLINSVNEFEATYLPVPTTGRTALYQRLNGLIAAYGLINTSGPDYAPLEILDRSKQKDEEQSGKSKFRSYFPGVYVTMTVEGPYANVRQFIRDIEVGGEFIVVSGVEIEPSDAADKPDQSDPASPNNLPSAGPGGFPRGVDPTTAYPMGTNRSLPEQPGVAQPYLPNSARGKTHGSIVSLKMEMAAYFRRPTLETLENGTAPQ